MYLVSAQKGHWLSQLCILSPIFKMKWLKKTAFCFSEFRCVWRKPSDAGGRSQDGGMKVGSWIRRPHDLSLLKCEGRSPLGASPHLSTHLGVWGRECAVHTLWTRANRAQKRHVPLCWECRENHMTDSSAGLPVDWRTCVGVGGGVCMCISALLLLLFSRSVVSDSLWPHGLQPARPPCPSPTPGVHWNSCSLSQWCDPTISSSAIPFSSHLQSFPASGSFPISQLFE